MIFVCKIDATATTRALKSTMEYVARLCSLARKDLAPESEQEDPLNVLASWLND